MEKVLMLISAFKFGCYLSKYLFKRKKKNQKEEIERFLKYYEKKYGLEQSGFCTKNKRE